MIQAIYHARTDDVLLLDDDGTPIAAIPRHQAHPLAEAIMEAADTPWLADRLTVPVETAWSAR